MTLREISEELFITDELRPDLSSVFGPVADASNRACIVDPSTIIRFSSCKESSTDGKEDTKKKEITKDDKGILAAPGSPSGPVTDNHLRISGPSSLRSEDVLGSALA